MTTLNFDQIRKDTAERRDPSLTIYMLRDTPEVEAAGLKDMAWVMVQNYCTRKEVEWFIDTLEKWVNENKETE